MFALYKEIQFQRVGFECSAAHYGSECGADNATIAFITPGENGKRSLLQ